VFPVSYELNFRILFRTERIFKGLFKINTPVFEKIYILFMGANFKDPYVWNYNACIHQAPTHDGYNF
jgi:hypothetical protein